VVPLPRQIGSTTQGLGIFALEKRTREKQNLSCDGGTRWHFAIPKCTKPSGPIKEPHAVNTTSEYDGEFVKTDNERVNHTRV
jgi:hypothetical protein